MNVRFESKEHEIELYFRIMNNGTSVCYYPKLFCINLEKQMEPEEVIIFNESEDRNVFYLSKYENDNWFNSSFNVNSNFGELVRRIRQMS